MVKLRTLACFAALSTAAPAVADQSITVDCGRGETIGRVLADKARKDKPLVMRVQGNCTENVTIERDEVALEGDGAGAMITGSLTIDNSRRVVVANLTVTNATGDGISVINSASAIIRDNNIVDNGGSGLAVRNASFAQVERNILSRNGRTIDCTPMRCSAQASGIVLGIGCTVLGLDNVMEDNRNAGIEVGDNSIYRSDGDRITALPTGRAGLDVYRAGFVDVRRTSVTGFVEISQQSQLQVRNVTGFAASTITGNMSVGGLSFLRLRSGVVHIGARTCFPGSICQVDP